MKGHKLTDSYFSHIPNLLYIPANFGIEGKVDKLIDLFIQPNIKGNKKPLFCFKLFIAISDEWDALFVSILFISFLRQ